MKNSNIDWIIKTDHEEVFTQIESLSIHTIDFVKKLKAVNNDSDFYYNQFSPIFKDYSNLVWDYKNYLKHNISISTDKKEKTKLQRYDLMLDSNFKLTCNTIVLALN